jgi:ribosomal protein L16 Arg81 hydroxylase
MVTDDVEKALRRVEVETPAFRKEKAEESPADPGGYVNARDLAHLHALLRRSGTSEEDFSRWLRRRGVRSRRFIRHNEVADMRSAIESGQVRQELKGEGWQDEHE